MLLGCFLFFNEIMYRLSSTIISISKLTEDEVKITEFMYNLLESAKQANI